MFGSQSTLRALGFLGWFSVSGLRFKSVLGSRVSGLAGVGLLGSFRMFGVSSMLDLGPAYVRVRKGK